METIESNDKSPALSIGRARFEIILADEIGAPLAMISPPIDDISEMAELERASFSLKEHIAERPLFLHGVREHLDRLLSKDARFGNSATFLNRVANFHGALSEFELEARAVERAAALRHDVWITRKVGESRIHQGRLLEAEEVFRGLAEQHDSQSALRVAAFEVGRGRLTEAMTWVERAVESNPEGYSERLFQGALNLLLGEFEAAIGYFRIALDDKPNSSAAYCNLGLAYIGLGRPDKAFEALKRSVAMEPFNSNAILALADVASLIGKDADAVNSLRYFVEFEQKESAVWGRLARCLLNLRLVDDCIVALKSQGALVNSSTVWNNLGVAYAIAKRNQASIQSLRYALTLEDGADKRGALIISRNIIQIFAALNEHQTVKRVSEDIIGQDSEGLLLGDPVLSDIYTYYITALYKSGFEEKALSLSEQILESDSIAPELCRWLVSSIVGARSIDSSNDEVVLSLLSRFTDLQAESGLRSLRLLNNFAFAFAEMGQLSEADRCIQRVSNYVHKDAYLTATLGLVNFRKGHVVRGEELYREAIVLANSARDKARIRQKLNLELGRVWMDKSAQKARKFLDKASAESHGEPALQRQARNLIKTLGRI